MDIKLSASIERRSVNNGQSIRRWLLNPTLLLSILFSLMAACSHSLVMTRPGFQQIELGTPIYLVIKEHGDPYSIKTNKDGSQEYWYIERVAIGETVIESNSYVLLIKNGQVISKHYYQELPPAYDEIYDEDFNHTQD